MIVTDLVETNHGFETELSARVRTTSAQRTDFTLWFRIPSEMAATHACADPFLAGLLIPCLCIGEDLHIEAPVSPRLFDSIPDIQRLIRGWYPEFHNAVMTCSEKREPVRLTNRPETACFFSAGVDSIYSLIKHQSEIDRLILVHGFENPVHEQETAATTARLVESIAGMLGKQVVEVKTNLRGAVFEHLIGQRRRYRDSFFGFCHQGSILAAVGLCLQTGLSRIYIPASYTYDTLVPYGTHPSLDPLWSTDILEFVHDGCEASRFKKIKRIATEAPTFTSCLQVCESNHPCENNCCRCDKCVRTMIALRLCNVLNQVGTFHLPLDLQRTRQAGDVARWRSEYQELLAEAKRIGDNVMIDTLGYLLEERLSVEGLLEKCKRLIGNEARYYAPSLFHRITGSRVKIWRTEKG